VPGVIRSNQSQTITGPPSLAGERVAPSWKHESRFLASWIPGLIDRLAIVPSQRPGLHPVTWTSSIKAVLSPTVGFVPAMLRVYVPAELTLMALLVNKT
jgi:hypothetical protein